MPATKWSNCSPGRLIIERTMAALHQDRASANSISRLATMPISAVFGVKRFAAGRSQRPP